MALKVKAQEKLQKIGTYAGKYRYIMKPELYTSLSQDKVIKEAALRSGVSKGIMQACWECCRRSNQGVGHRRPLSSAAWSGYNAIRTASQVGREGGRG